MGQSNGGAWEFVDAQGSFRLENPQDTSYLYFPLVNEAGMMSAITPSLHGSITSGHNTFLMEPISVESLHNSNAARNFWLFVEGEGAWSVSGNSAQQQGAKFSGQEEESEVEAGFLWHKLTRKHKKVGLVAETTSVVPGARQNPLSPLSRFTLHCLGHSWQLSMTAQSFSARFFSSPDL